MSFTARFPTALAVMSPKVAEAAMAELQRVLDSPGEPDWAPEDRDQLGALLGRFRSDLLAARADATGWSTHKETSPS